MIRSTPHPPQNLLDALPAALSEIGLFTVKAGVKVEDVLIAAAEYLNCASATAYEVADNQTAEFRPLARSVMHQMDTARLLIEAALNALNHEPQVIGLD